MAAKTTRVFLLSPAHSGGRRAAMLLRPEAEFPLARRVRDGSGASLGEVFAFLSGLYFRGKLAYAERFAQPPAVNSGALVITSNRGLVPAAALVDAVQLRAFAEVPIELANPRYRDPLCATARALDSVCGPRSEIVLLGSIATDKYCGCLLPIFGERLLFPAEFVGRGDMSRGGLMLRAAASGTELRYIPVLGALRHGGRPPKLTPQTRVPAAPEPAKKLRATILQRPKRG